MRKAYVELIEGSLKLSRNRGSEGMWGGTIRSFEFPGKITGTVSKTEDILHNFWSKVERT